MGQIVLASSAVVTGTGPVSGSAQSTYLIDTPNYQINLIATDVQATSFRIGLEDTPDGTTWTPLYVWSVAQLIEANQVLLGYNLPGLKVGSNAGTNAAARLNAYDLEGTQSAKITAVISWAS